MVGKDRKVKNDTLVVDTTTTNVIIKHEQLLLSPASSHSSDNSETTSQCFSLCEQKAIIKCEDNSESTSSNDKLDR